MGKMGINNGLGMGGMNGQEKVETGVMGRENRSNGEVNGGNGREMEVMGRKMEVMRRKTG